LNRSRNRGRNSDSSGAPTLEYAASSILNDKLKSTLSSLNSRSDFGKLKNKASGEKKVGHKKPQNMPKPQKQYAGYDKRKVNNQLLGNIIKNNINELASKNAKINSQFTAGAKLESPSLKAHAKNVRNQHASCLNNKENNSRNQTFGSKTNDLSKNEGTEVYNLNQY
jgi:hypothetical protein